MGRQEGLLVERLLAAPNPREVHGWAGRDGYYVAACRAAAADVPGLIEVARRWTDCDWPYSDETLDGDTEEVALLPVTAWRTLADLRSDAAVEPLLDMLRESDDEIDDWISEDLPDVFGKIGPSAVEPLIRVARDSDEAEFVRSVAVRSLRCVADGYTETRDRIVAALTEVMAAGEADVHFNATLLVELVDLHAVEAAEPIERAFAEDRIDVGMMGDWEEVRKELGVEGLGLAMPERPHNSMESFRVRMGLGIFSKQPLYKYGEIDEDAERAYYQRAWDTFSKSREAQAVVDRYGDLGWFRMLLEFGLNYLGESVDAMTSASVRDFVLGYVPRKVSVEPSEAASIVGELTSFWEYVDRVYALPQAKPIVAWLMSNGLVKEVEARLSDPSNFGMAKSFMMSGRKAGYDMTSEAGLQAFMTAYNRSLLEEKSPPPSATRPIARKEKVGRNDPCPCGSGKKFKKCCL